MNAEQSSKKDVAQADPSTHAGKAGTSGEVSERSNQTLCRGSGDSMHTRKTQATGSPIAWSVVATNLRPVTVR